MLPKQVEMCPVLPEQVEVCPQKLEVCPKHLSRCDRWVLCVSWTGAGVKVVFEKEMGAVDFLLPNRSCVLYVSECDIIAGNAYKRKLVRFRNVRIYFKSNHM